MSAQIDRTAWGPGPWSDEPDSLEFEHAGLRCVVVRHPMGHLCGYVALAPGQPWGRGNGLGEGAPREMFGHAWRPPMYGQCAVRPSGGERSCSHTLDGTLHVHGGVTYSGVGVLGTFALGFDCAHFMDLAPGLEATLRTIGAPERDQGWRDTYRTVDYVAGECRALADQLAQVRPGDHMRMRWKRLRRRLARVAALHACDA
jgi:hypothetical protein